MSDEYELQQYISSLEDEVANLEESVESLTADFALQNAELSNTHAALADMREQRDTYQEHSVILNSMCWEIALTLGIVNKAANHFFDGDPGSILDRLLSELASAKDDALFYSALVDAGVDNWGGYDYARKTYQEWKEEKE